MLPIEISLLSFDRKYDFSWTISENTYTISTSVYSNPEDVMKKFEWEIILFASDLLLNWMRDNFIETLGSVG